MTEEAARFVVSSEGSDFLAEITKWPGDAPNWALRLAKERALSAEKSAAILEVAAARQRAKRRFPDADRLFFDRESLAQATAPAIARFHARQLAPLGRIADLGCGVGMDAVAFAAAGAEVFAVEQNPARLIFAEKNAEARGVAEKIEFACGDVTALNWSADAAYFDPARRTQQRRVSRHAEQYEPPLSFLEKIQERVRGGIAKLSPALPDEILDSLGGRIAFLSEERECKEACLLFGRAATDSGLPSYSALLLPEEKIYSRDAVGDLVPVASAACTYIFDLDPAIVRAGALCALAEEINARLLSSDDAYLTGDHLPQNRRAASAYKIESVQPYHPRALKTMLRAQNVGRIVLKKRHVPVEPEQVRRDLSLSGKAEMTLILVRQNRQILAVLAQPVQ